MDAAPGALLHGLDVFFVGVRCDLDELEKRERQRADRPLEYARRDSFTVHLYAVYDIDVETTSTSPDSNAARIIAAHAVRKRRTAFDRMAPAPEMMLKSQFSLWQAAARLTRETIERCHVSWLEACEHFPYFRARCAIHHKAPHLGDCKKPLGKWADCPWRPEREVTHER